MKKIEPVNKFGHVVALIFITILLFSGLRFLRSHPLLSGLSLIGFALFYFVSVRILEQGYFIYPGVLLFTTGYYFVLSQWQVGAENYPLLSIPIALAIFFFERRFRKTGHDLAVSVERNLGLFIVFFSFFVLFTLPAHLRANMPGAIVPLLAFSLIYLFHFLETRKLFSQISCLILFSGAYLLTLHWIKQIPTAYHGLFLILLCMGMMAVGNRYQSRFGFSGVRGFYVVGQLLSLATFLYAVRDQSVVLICLTIFSFHYVGFSRSLSLKATAWRYSELMLYKLSFAVANLAGLVYIVLIFFSRFTPPLTVLLTSLGYVFICGRIAHGREGTILKARNQYAYLSGFFATVSVLVLLRRLDPLGAWEKNMFLMIPLILAVLYLGYKAEKGKRMILSLSFYETAIGMSVISLFLPSLTGEPDALLGIILALCFLPCFLFFWRLSGQRVLLYPFSVVFSCLYYGILNMADIPGALKGLYLIPGGLAALAIAIAVQKKGGGSAGIFYFAWVFLAGLSLVSAWTGPGIRVYVVCFWAVCFLVASQVVRGNMTPADACARPRANAV